jgi:hypothetical protein
MTLTMRALCRRRVCDESHHDELMDAVPLELQIQICVGETTGTPNECELPGNTIQGREVSGRWRVTTFRAESGTGPSRKLFIRSSPIRLCFPQTC